MVQAEIISRRHAREAAEKAQQRLEEAERRAQTDTHPLDIQRGQLPRETPRSAVTPDEVNAAWARAFAANAISFCAVDDEHFREAVKLTAECGQDYLNPQHESRLPHRTSFVTKTIKNEGNSVADTVDTSVTTAADTSGGTLLSDGSKSKSKKALINILFNTEAGTQSLCTVPATEVVKDMRYIANLLIQRITAIGPHKVTALCMDGACFGCFRYIQERFPHIHCYICPTHSLDNFIKNICSKKPLITIRGQGSFEWGESIFYDAIRRVKTVVRAVCAHQYSLDAFRRIKDRENNGLPRGAEKYKDLMKFCRTRFLSQVLMVIRFDLNLPVLNLMMHDRSFVDWLSSQSTKIQDKFRSVMRIVRSSRHGFRVKVLIRTVEHCIALLRVTDGKTGATLGKVYGRMLTLNEFNNNPILGLDESVRKKIHRIFYTRWLYFDIPVMAAAFMTDPEYIRNEFTTKQQEALDKTMEVMACDEHPLDDLIREVREVMQHIKYRRGPFSRPGVWKNAERMTAAAWARSYPGQWPHAMWFFTRIGVLPCSASQCEHSWSVQGWIQSSLRNCMSASLADHMVRFHSNLRLLASLRRADTQVLPWELELSVETEVDLTDREDSNSESEDDGYGGLNDGDEIVVDDDDDEQDGGEMKENDEDEIDDDEEEQDEEDDQEGLGDQEDGSEDDDDDDSDDDIPLGRRARRTNALLSLSDDEECQGRHVNWTHRKRRNVST